MTVLVPALVALALGGAPDSVPPPAEPGSASTVPVEAAPPPADLTPRASAAERSPVAGPSLDELRERRSRGKTALVLGGLGLAGAGLSLSTGSRDQQPQNKRNAIVLGSVALAAVGYGASLLTSDPPRPRPARAPRSEVATAGAPSPPPDLTPRLPSSDPRQPTGVDLEARRRELVHDRRVRGALVVTAGVALALAGAYVRWDHERTRVEGKFDPLEPEFTNVTSYGLYGAGAVSALLGTYLLATPPPGLP